MFLIKKVMIIASSHNGDCFFEALMNSLRNIGISFESPEAVRRKFLSEENIRQFQKSNRVKAEELVSIVSCDMSSREQRRVQKVCTDNMAECIHALSKLLCTYDEGPVIWVSGGIIAIVAFHLKYQGVKLRIARHKESEPPNGREVVLLYQADHYESIV